MFMPGQYHGCLTLTLTHGCWWSDMQGAKSSAAMVEVMTVLDIKNNAWVTVNNDFWVTSEAICQWFSRVTKSRVKIIGKSHHEWPKNRYSWQRMYYFISYTLFYVPGIHNSAENHHPSLISQLSPRTAFSDFVTPPELICDVTLTPDTSIVTSYSSIILAHANWRKGDLH